MVAGLAILEMPWLNHNDAAIYSVDFHPSGRKLATGGQKSDSEGDRGMGMIAIWDISASNDVPHPRQQNKLAEIIHQRTVNCVRWSRADGGRYLAAGGDDAAITVYECAGRGISAGSIGQPNTKASAFERYRCTARLYGHQMDVLHFEWSADGRFLASGSVDGNVIVWNAQKLPEKVVILDAAKGGHKESVKGVSWDPIGKFLCSQSADKTLKVWSTDSWECFTTLAKPFEETTQSSVFSRMDWSPDGQHLLVPGGMNNGGPVVNVLLRKDWSYRKNLVGSRKVVTCVRACPWLFKYKDEAGATRYTSCFAVGSRDKCLSIWSVPRSRRPLLVVEKMFTHTIVDLSWHGNLLVASSIDGTARFVSVPFSLFGDVVPPDQLKLLQGHLHGVSNDSRITDYDLNSWSQVLCTKDWKRETNEDAKKRITVVDEEKHNESQESADDRMETDQRDEEKENAATGDRLRTQRKRTSSLGSAISVESPTFKAASASSKSEHQRKARASQNGAEVQYQYFEALGDEPDLCASLFGNRNPPEFNEVLRKTMRLYQQERYNVDLHEGEDTLSLEELRRVVDELFPKEPEDEEQPSTSTSAPAVVVCEPPVGELPAVSTIPPRKRMLFARVRRLPDMYGVDANNDVQLAGSSCARIEGCAADGSIAWSAYLEDSVALLKANRFWTVATTYRDTMIVHSTRSGALKFTVLLDSTVSILLLDGSFCLTIFTDGSIRSWDLKRCKCVVESSMGILLRQHGDKLNCISFSQGIPNLVFPDNISYKFSANFNEWELASSQPQDTFDQWLKRLDPSRGEAIADHSAIEQLLEEARQAGSKMRFRFWTKVYVQLLLARGEKERLAQFVYDVRHEDKYAKVRKVHRYWRPILEQNINLFT